MTVHRTHGSSVPVPRQSVHHVQIASESVLTTDHTDEAHVLDSTASLVWQCLDGVSTIGEIVADLAVAFDAPAEQIQSDIEHVVDRFLDAGLLASSDIADGSPEEPVGPDMDAGDGSNHGLVRFLEEPPHP